MKILAEESRRFDAAMGRFDHAEAEEKKRNSPEGNSAVRELMARNGMTARRRKPPALVDLLGSSPAAQVQLQARVKHKPGGGGDERSPPQQLSVLEGGAPPPLSPSRSGKGPSASNRHVLND